MSDIMKTHFVPSLWNIWDMRKQASQIAEDAGLTQSEQKDAFRHAYVSAKIRENFGEKAAQILGAANEILRGAGPLLGGNGNPTGDWEMDEANNMAGRKIEEELAKQELSPRAKEKLLRTRIRDAVLNGELVTAPVPQTSPQPPFDYIFPGPVMYSAQETIRNGDGDVAVQGYSRSTGEVKGHLRTWPDGNVGNNKSYRKK